MHKGNSEMRNSVAPPKNTDRSTLGQNPERHRRNLVKSIFVLLGSLTGLCIAILGMLFANGAMIDYRGGYCLGSLSAEATARIAQQRFLEDIKCSDTDCSKYFDQPQTVKYCNAYPENSFAIPFAVNCTAKNVAGIRKFEVQKAYSVTRCGRIKRIEGWGNFER